MRTDIDATRDCSCCCFAKAPFSFCPRKSAQKQNTQEKPPGYFDL
ncbi:hypothetical protein CLOSTMETH_02613 [[Clostridium] methylpentosum DSM 5476]|uniref:Uncharacterized protein n=1 Tax=[Clostridium] methylpentosum DSM 5476 TaxID=537013 RepID=C0EFH1_9FIRM|nr:hypothetical protein CLOSTMETH_02613 [[Clostridium] methylpentosum DSM 5476]